MDSGFATPDQEAETVANVWLMASFHAMEYQNRFTVTKEANLNLSFLGFCVTF